MRESRVSWVGFCERGMIPGRSESLDLVLQNHISQNVSYFTGRATGPAVGDSENVTVYVLSNLSVISNNQQRKRRLQEKDRRGIAGVWRASCYQPDRVGTPGELSDYSPGTAGPVPLSPISPPMWWWSQTCLLLECRRPGLSPWLIHRLVNLSKSLFSPPLALFPHIFRKNLSLDDLSHFFQHSGAFTLSFEKSLISVLLYL